MALFAWLAAFAALLTGIAMLKDTVLGRAQRVEMRTVVARAWRAGRLAGVGAIDLAEVTHLVRFVWRAVTLILITAASGVCVFLPRPAGPYYDIYDVALSAALVAFLAMQAPCPWLRYIAKGPRHDACPTNRGDTGAQ